jgi:hypothetical protein
MNVEIPEYNNFTPANFENGKNNGWGGGSRTRVRKCYWSRDCMLIRIHALGITQRRSRRPLRTDKKRLLA